ncbi:MAG: thiolase family protein [Alicyclobacillaceae bacterium]|nr:thiolase family protein [Alicyclobacillaceae bacterium]
MRDVVVVDGVRSAIGSFGKAFKDVHVSDLGAKVLAEAIRRSGVAPEEVEEAVFGCVGQFAENAFIARMIALKAGMPVSSTALTVNRLCSSGLQAIVTAARTIQAGDADVVAAGGAENMSQYPYYVRGARWGLRLSHGQFEDGLLIALSDPFKGYQMGVTAENLVRKFGISREDQDRFAYRSQVNAARAIAEGKFKEEIVPIEVREKKAVRVVDEDEHVRKDTTYEKLAQLKPAFEDGGTVTAGNSSGINDAAAALILMSAEAARARGLRPKLRFVDYAVSGVDPAIMGYGPVDAIAKVLRKAGLSLDDIGLIELNEAFAAQALAVIRGAGLDMERVNVNGGAIAHGHPIGATGAILTIKLMNEMIRTGTRYGMVTLCIGGGQGLAAIFENIA